MRLQPTAWDLLVRELVVSDQIKLVPDVRRWWRVQATSPNFIACVQQVPFQVAGTYRYTVLDLRQGIRGPCNLVGQGWGDGTYSELECAELLDAFEARDIEREYDASHAALGLHSWPAYEPITVEISHRNNVVLHILDVRRARAAA